MTKIEEGRGNNNSPKKREKKRKARAPCERNPTRGILEKCEHASCTSLISLSTRAFEAKVEGKGGRERRGRERQMGRFSVGRMSDFHADETARGA